MIQATAALVAAVVACTLVTLPPRSVHLTTALPPTVAYGAYHIHTTHSDGSGTPDDVALAASRAGLKFVLLTDHGDATRALAPPTYLHGVLVIDGTEITTAVGHLVALGLPNAAPYPLGGEADDVIEDVHRLGGFAVVAHPDSPKFDLSWRGSRAAADGVEWLNADAEWRDESRLKLIGTLSHFFVRPAESLAELIQRPARTLQRWDADMSAKSIVGLAAADAHGTMGWRGKDQSGGVVIGDRLYEQIFRTFAQAVVLDAPLSGAADVDAAAILHAVRSGHTFSIITAFASPASIDLTASDGVATARMGERLIPASSTITISARVPEAPDAHLVLMQGGHEIISGAGDLHISRSADSAAYRVEVYRGASRVPWIVSNPVYVGAEVPSSPVVLSKSLMNQAVSITDNGAWAIEHATTSTAETSVDGAERVMRFDLGLEQPKDEYVALAHDMSDNTGAFDRVQFTARADRPMRVSLQLRLLGPAGQRWAKSIYLDQTPRSIVAPLQSLRPVGLSTSSRPIAARVQAVLFVIDAINAATGATGKMWISGVSLGNAEMDQVRTVSKR